jgi:hypothetical protein
LLCRLTDYNVHMSYLAGVLTDGSMNVTAASLALPPPLQRPEQLLQMLDVAGPIHSAEFMHPLMPVRRVPAACSYDVLRGVRRDSVPDRLPASGTLPPCRSAAELWGAYGVWGAARTHTGCAAAFACVCVCGF